MAGMTNDDPASRVRAASFEAERFLRNFRVVGWLIGVGSGCIVGGLAYLQTPYWVTMGSATALIILGTAALINLVAARSYIQRTYTEMTVSHLEKEIIAIRDRVEQTESTLTDIAKWTRPPRSDY